MQNCLAWDLAGGPTVKTEIPLQGVGGFDPWSGNLKSHMPCVVVRIKKKKKNCLASQILFPLLKNRNVSNYLVKSWWTISEAFSIQ